MKKVVVLLFLAIYAVTGVAQEADKIVGIWWNDKKTSKIEVKQKDGKYIGTVIYIAPEEYENGKPPIDDENPDPKLRDRSIVGLQILDGLEFNAKKKEWKDGSIYDPDSGKTYECYAWLENEKLLKLKGFVAGVRWMGRSTEWYRAE